MPLHITCPGCKTICSVGDALVGKQVRCTRCQKVFLVTAPAPVKEAPPASVVVAKQSSPSTSSAQPPPPIPSRGKAAPAPMPQNSGPSARPPGKGSRPWLVGGAAAALVALTVGGLSYWLWPSKRSVEEPPAASPVASAPTEPRPEKKQLAEAAKIEPVKATGAEKIEPAVVANPPRPGDPARPPTSTAIPPAGTSPATSGIPFETLQAIKNATVYVRVKSVSGPGSGSGFVMRVEDDTAYVVTNHHVVVPDFGPEVSSRRTGRVVRSKPAQVLLVFNSGTDRERSAPATIVSTDPSRDLAILKVNGVKDLPKAIDFSQPPKYVETMPVHVFGFPFGQMLSTSKGSGPAVTVTPGTVSSIRLDERGEMAIVQIAGSINPGNSGGPVVDAQGRLVGVAVATIRGTGIGLAIPSEELTKLLHGRVARVGLGWPVKDAEKPDLEIDVELIDPFGRVKEVGLIYLRQDKIPEGADKHKNFIWSPLPGGQKVPLKLDGQRATAKLDFPTTDPNDLVMTYQAYVVNGEGKTIYTQPVTARAPKARPVASRPTPSPGTQPPYRSPPPPGWKHYIGTGKQEFTVLLPADGKVTESENTVGSPRYGRMQDLQVSCERSDGSRFLASQVLMTGTLQTMGSDKARHEIFQEFVLKELKGQMLESKSISFNGVPAMEYLIQTPQSLARYRMIRSGSYMFRVAVFGKKEQLHSRDVERFFMSFHRIKPFEREKLEALDPKSTDTPKPGETATPPKIAQGIREGKFVKPETAKAPVSYVRLISTPGDPIGLGKNYVHEGKDMQVSGNEKNFTIKAAGWTIRAGHARTNALVLTTKEYRGVNRFTMSRSEAPAFSCFGYGKNSSRVSVDFVIWEMEVSGQEITKLAIDFVQRSEMKMPPLYGSIRYNSSFE